MKTDRPATATPACRVLTLRPGSQDFADLADTLLRQGVEVCFRAFGGNMVPFVRSGDTLTIRPCAPDACRLGDLVLARQAGGGVVAHRLLARRKSQAGLLLLLRGDHSCGTPDAVAADAILGHAVLQGRGGMRRRPDRLLWRLAGLLFARMQSTRGRLRPPGSDHPLVLTRW